MHGAFKFWDRRRRVASAKGIQDIKVAPPKARSRKHATRFQAFGKHVEMPTPERASLRVTVGFHDPASDAGSACSSQVQAFRTGRRGRLLAP